MLSSLGKGIFALIILLTLVGFFVPVIHRIRIIRSGLPDKRFRHLGRRLGSALSKILLQLCTLKNERVFSGFMHVFIFYGALTFDTMTLNHTLEGFFPDFYLFGDTGFGLFFSLMVDVFAVLVLVGVLFFAFRRFILRPKAYATTPMDSLIIYVALTLVTLSYMYFEVFAIAHHPESERLAFLGGALSESLCAGMSAAAVNQHFHIAWWLHILLVYGFIVYVPHSKYFHMIAGSFNLLVNRDTPMGELPALDIENSEVFGIEKGLDYTWKDLLDSFACMECGRCQDACPAFASDKPLSPKMIIFNLKNHLLQDGAKYKSRDRESLKSLMDGVFTPDEIWACTTCGACMHVCPVEIEHIPKIVGLRRGQVLMESKFPGELNAFFRNMETNSNPWGIGFSDRAAWAEGLDVKLMSESPQAGYLFWVGCAGSFDEEGKKISQALVSVLQKARIDFAILGAEEKCCGDSARRLGNEYLYQMQAAENILAFHNYGVQRIITICPHGYNTFKNEYPALLPLLPDLPSEAKESFGRIEILHHTQLIAELLREGKIHLNSGRDLSLTYHDSCYLGRHNGIIKEPREILSRVDGARFKELPQCREHSFCCGAGGGLMWTEESLGQRINHMRTAEVISTSPDLVVTSCPFCQTMLVDGLKDKEQAHIKVKDIAQLVAESLAD
jgi:Fe-S oxidoreductase/nitrate reductase gamma subunit